MYILQKDRKLLEERLVELAQRIRDLGEEFHEVLNQSSETWHDNAPWDAVRDKQALMKAEYDQLKAVLANSSLKRPFGHEKQVEIGCIVDLMHNNKSRTIFISGDWSYRAGSIQYESFVVSAQSPIAKALLYKKCGDSTQFGTITAFRLVEEH